MHYWKRGLAFLLSVSCILTCSIPRTAAVYAATAEETAAADAVDVLIDGIGDITRYSQKADIEAARAAYNDLTVDAKAEVEGLGKLESAERVIGLYADSTILITDQKRENAEAEILKADGIFKDVYSPNGYAFDTKFTVPDAEDAIGSALSGTNAFSMEVWVNPAELNIGNTFIAKGNFQTSVKIAGGSGSEKLEYCIVSGGNWTVTEAAVADTTFKADKWNHIVASYDGTKTELYINGELEATTTTNVAVNNRTDYDLTVGYMEDGNNSLSLNGKMAAAHVYSKALSQAEVTANYSKAATALTAASDNVLCWYDADDFGAKFTEKMQEVVDAVKAIEALPATLAESDVTAVNAANALYLALDTDQKAEVPAGTKDKLDEAVKGVEAFKDIFTVTFDSNGGSDVAPKDVYDAAAVEEPYAPTKDKHVFRGWNLDGKPYNFNTPVTKAITLIAQWESYESVAAKVDALIDGIGEIENIIKKPDVEKAREEYDKLADDIEPYVTKNDKLASTERILSLYEKSSVEIADQARENGGITIDKADGVFVDPYSVDGYSPNGYAFDTISEIPDVNGDLNQVLSGAVTFTIETWLKPQGDGNGMQTIIGKGDDQVCVRTNNPNRLLLYVKDNGWQNYEYDTPAGWLNKWHHLVFVVAEGTVKTYCDGVELANVNATTIANGHGNIQATDMPLWIGRQDEKNTDRDGNYRYASVHIYKRALSADEVTANYTARGNADYADYAAADVLCWYDANNFKAKFTEDMQAVVDAVEAIEALPATPAESDVDAVDAANALYLALNDTQKKDVPGGTEDKLEAALAAVAEFKNKVKVTFKADAETTLKDVYVPSGQAVPAKDVPTPTKTGYVFNGWYLDGTKYNFNTQVTENITLIADWKPVADAAGEVDKRINAIGEIKDYSKKKDIEAARAAYDALTDEAKEQVKNLSVLEKAERLIGYYETATTLILDQKREDAAAEIEKVQAIVADPTSPNGYAFDTQFKVPEISGDLNTVLSGNTGFAMEVWVNPKTLTVGNTFIAKGNNQVSLKLANYNGKVVLEYCIFDGNWQALTVESGAFTANNWHHLVANYDGAKMELYVDGSLAGTKEVATTVRTSDKALGVGFMDGEAGNVLDGKMAAAHVYNRALTAEEVAANYAGSESALTAEDESVVCWYDANMYDAKFATDLADVIVSIENMPDAESVTGDTIAQVNRINAAFEALSDDDKAQVSDELKTKLNAAVAKVATLKYTVTFKEAADAEGTTVEVAGGKAVAEPDAPTKEGYIFKGWYLGDAKYNFKKAVTKDITLIAKWEEESKDPGKDDPGKDDPGKDDPGKDDPGKDDPGKDDPGKDDPGKDDPGKNDPSKDNPSKDDPGKDPANGSQGGSSKTDEVKVSKIKISGISKKIAAGKKITLTANVTPKNATNTKVIWRSSNTKYATVNENGKVSVKKAGANKSVTITAEAADGSGVKASYEISIMKNAVKKITLKANKKTVKANATVKVKAGKKLTLKASVAPSKKVNKTLKWTSSNTKYATVSKKGVVTTKKAGKGKTVKITAKATDGSNKKITVKVKITK